ncbi:hypothetical protein ACTWPT_30385 [Nonomuraea sp. 3N208]|uniref:hypothetical protein n=1 Tax=Nonomuraea sp. 3N208 TaxID=3457421 RepID=UPI003FD19C49
MPATGTLLALATCGVGYLARRSHSMPGMYCAFDRSRELAGGPRFVVAGRDARVLERFPLVEPDIAVISE